MGKKIFLTFFLSGMMAIMLPAQLILAGQYQQSDHFFDFVPDTLSHNLGTDSIELDMNGDGTTDLLIRNQYQPPWNWGYEFSALIIPGNNTEVAFLRTDSCFSQDSIPMFAYTTGIAKAFMNSDTIDARTTWVDSAIYFRKNYANVLIPTGSPAGCSCYSSSFGNTYAYAGVRIFTPDTLYGWIKLKIMTGGAYHSDTISIDSYACQTMLIGIPSQEEPSQGSFFPNPSTGIFKSTGMFSSGRLEVKDISGRIIYSDELKNETPVIDLSGEVEGIYFLTIKTNEDFYSQRLILCR